jgi:hypothetical protein
MRRLVAVLAIVLAVGLAACSPDESGGGAGAGASGGGESPELLSGAPAQSSAN